MKYGVLPFRFGRAATEPISPSFDKFYAAVAQMCADSNVVLARSNSPISVPLAYEMISDAQLMFRISSAHLEAWIGDANLVIIDLANPVDQILPNHHIIGSLNALIRYYSTTANSRKRRFLLLLPAMLAELDPVMQSIADLIDDGTLAAISNNGISLRSAAFGASPDEKRYVEALAIAHGRPEDAIRRKLVRFPGHFKRYADKRHSHCTSYYFDGRLCEAELVNYLDHYFASIDPTPSETQILYHATISRWLSNAVEAFGKRRKREVTNLALDFRVREDVRNVTLVLPLVDTGNTLDTLCNLIRQRAPKAKIRVLTVLATQRPLSEPGSFNFAFGSEEVRVDFIAAVMQQRFAPGECPACKLNIEATDPVDPDPFDKLSTHAFWALAMELGFEREENVPPYRNSLGFIPAFKRINDMNGPFLAYKVHKLLRSSRDLPANPIVICPQEDGVGAIANWLESVFGITVIRIPKTYLGSDSIAQELASPPEAFFLNSEAQPAWLTQLQSLRYFQEEFGKGRRVLGSPNYSVIILDEINSSGKTRSLLVNLAAKFQLNIICCMSLVDFAPFEKPSEMRVTSLYEIDLVSVRDRRGVH
ncbi:MAG: hypothetical protein HOP13_09155 [Alphaproteobacteria bacterium]|nr:hypothetical protein [Alphaproteobacteria bacterium]